MDSRLRFIGTSTHELRLQFLALFADKLQITSENSR